MLVLFQSPVLELDTIDLRQKSSDESIVKSILKRAHSQEEADGKTFSMTFHIELQRVRRYRYCQHDHNSSKYERFGLTCNE